MSQPVRSVRPSPNTCEQCNGSANVTAPNTARPLCRCELNETGEPLNTSRDPIWVDEFSGTNESAVRFGGRTHRSDRYQSFGEDVRQRTTAAYRWVRSRIVTGRDYYKKYTNRSFLCGSLLLILGTYFFILPDDYLRYRHWAFALIAIGGVFVWIPVFYWMSEQSEENSGENQGSQTGRHHVRAMDEPPRYEDTLPGLPPGLPKDDPPPYDLVFPNAENYFQPHSSDASAFSVPVCSVHQPTATVFSEPRTQRTTVDAPGLHRSRSLGDLS